MIYPFATPRPHSTALSWRAHPLSVGATPSIPSFVRSSPTAQLCLASMGVDVLTAGARQPTFPHAPYSYRPCHAVYILHILLPTQLSAPHISMLWSLIYFFPLEGPSNSLNKLLAPKCSHGVPAELSVRLLHHLHHPQLSHRRSQALQSIHHCHILS